jgi:Nucleotidyl transferase AbiEii toxin, Type IV TA system
VRYRVAAELAGRPFEQVIVDVGFGGPLPAAAETLRGPDLLTFADFAPLTIPVLPLEQHVAEKLHAYTRSYGEGRQNTRVKDLVDLVLIQASAAFEAERLWAALVATFAGRSSQPLPTAVPVPPANWGSAYRGLAGEVGLTPEPAAGYRSVALFLDAILTRSLEGHARWEAPAGVWVPGSGLKSLLGTARTTVTVRVRVP